MAKQAASQTRQNGALQSAAQFSSHICIQREARAQGVEPGALPLVKQVLSSPGRPLDSWARRPMEQRLGVDFSGVRVHTDQSAAESARAVHANAYTAGLDLVFADSKYAPASLTGQRLIAHELSHVAQQARGPVSGIPIGDGFSISMPGDTYEQQAQRAANYGATEPYGWLRPMLPESIRPGLISRDGWDVAGAVAGIAGAAIGAVALGFAIAAWLRPKNPKAPGGAISFNPNPFQFSTAVQEPSAKQDSYRNSLQGEPREHKVIDLRTDNDNHAEVNLALKTDKINVVDAVAEVGDRQGYEGGSSGSSATVSFTQAPLPTAGSPTASSLFAQPAQPANGGGATPPAAETAAPAASGGTAAPAAPAPAEVLVRFSGMNIDGNETPQGFSGEIQVKADDTAQCTHCRPTTREHDNVEVRDGVAYIDFRPKPRPSGGSDIVGPSPEPSGGPGFQWPELPINRPWTGSAGGGT